MNKMKIKLDNLDKDDGTVTVYCDDKPAAVHDQSIDGAMWEAPADLDVAYACISDRPGLVADLKEEGYEVDTSAYWEEDDENE